MRHARGGADFRSAWHPASRTEFYYLGQDLNFIAPVKIGDTIEVTVTVAEKRDDKRIIKLRTTASNQRGEIVIDGTAVVKKVGL
jgi:3-hydroxybutyryl-CoA dehydratase